MAKRISWTQGRVEFKVPPTQPPFRQSSSLEMKGADLRMTDRDEFNLIEEFCKHSSPALKSREGAFAAAAFVRESVKDGSPLVLVEKSSLATGDPWNLRHISLSETGEIDELLALLGKIKQGLQNDLASQPD